jgi:uncharacterized protein (UPF0371 family)
VDEHHKKDGGSMLGGIGFDNDKYLEEQTSYIIERAKKFDNKLYLEFGGKLVFDYHATRVLPGFHPNAKIELLQKLKDNAEIVICIYAGDIERKKVRADFGITYDVGTMKLIDDLTAWGIDVRAVVVTRYEEQPSAKQFISTLERRNIRVYKHRATKGYPTDIDTIVSDEGYGANEYIETEKPIVVVTAPGPGSGKLGTCLSQLYHEHKNGVDAGYAKFETFPIWSIPLKHPVNIAYESATADLKDYNLVDPFHLEAHGETSINYNRDVEVFPVVRRILERIMGAESVYKSPTDMGVNRAGFAIIDDDITKEASIQEIIRRYLRYSCEYAMGFCEKDTVERAKLLMEEVEARVSDRKVVPPAREAAKEAEEAKKGKEGIFCGAAVELQDGAIIKGKNSPLMHAASSLVLNAIKHLAGMPDDIHLISPTVVDSIAKLKEDILNDGRLSLDLEETLIALSVSSISNPAVQAAIEKLKELSGCEVHVTHMPTPGDEAGLRKLGVNLTSDPNFASKNLYIS